MSSSRKGFTFRYALHSAKAKNKGRGTTALNATIGVDNNNTTTAQNTATVTESDDEFYDDLTGVQDRLDEISIDEDGLCQACARLDLEHSLNDAYDLYEGARRGRNARVLEVYRGESDRDPPYLGFFYYVTSLGGRLSRNTACKLCNFFRSSCLAPRKGTYKVLAVCSSESYLFSIPKKDKRGSSEKRPWGEIDHNVFLAVVPEVPGIPKVGMPLRWLEVDMPKVGAIYRQTQLNTQDRLDLVLPVYLWPDPSWELVKLWLDACRDTHRFCSPDKSDGVSLPGFRVIDCEKTPPVVESQNWRVNYVALSYVWGVSTEDWPPTILDAVEVTKKLGVRYLWVDRLCIDQTNVQEKQSLISRMDMVYKGAIFTIINAAGDASTGLPGVSTYHRDRQPIIQLKTTRTSDIAHDTRGENINLLGISGEEYERTCVDRVWLDPHRFGLWSGPHIAFDQDDMAAFQKDSEIMDRFKISLEDLIFFQTSAEDSGETIDEHMMKMQLLAQRMGIQVSGLLPSFQNEAARRQGLSPEAARNIKLPPARVTRPSKPDRGLPPPEPAGSITLISTLEDPRVTIKASTWGTRGWTYQEAILSKRRLVFTQKQLYWECNGMVCNETLSPLELLDPSHTRSADYRLSGIFDAEDQQPSILRYGFPNRDQQGLASEEVSKLDGHITAFTSRDLTNENDSLNAFLGIAAIFSNRGGLGVFWGLPVWTGVFASGLPGFQDSFALSLTSWVHTAAAIERGAEMFVADCRRRPRFPSWTWVGWQGCMSFSTDQPARVGGSFTASDTIHKDFFKAMTESTWWKGMYHIYTVETIIHSEGASGIDATLLAGNVPISRLATDQSRTLLLTIRSPYVLKHMYLMRSTLEGEWRRLMGKEVQLHLDRLLMEQELIQGHTSGRFMSVLIFTSMVPFVYTGTARFMILERAIGHLDRWERVGLMIMKLEEQELMSYANTAELLRALPIRRLDQDCILL